MFHSKEPVMKTTTLLLILGTATAISGFAHSGAERGKRNRLPDS